ncbi:MAG: hypothetical protein AAF206_27225 [Bacteroidota bacterium]
MDIVKELEQLEDKFYGEWEEDKGNLSAALLSLHISIDDPDEFNRFLVQSADRFGGAYIPYLFWSKLSTFINDNPDARIYIQQLLKAFVDSNFDDDEQRRMKPLVVTYLAREKDFEIDKIWTKTVDKAHPSVQEYFQKLRNFVNKNQKATEMYCEKFMLLKDSNPDFDLLGLPITQLRERLQQA